MNTRNLAIKALKKINEGGFSNIVLDNILQDVNDKRDRALITKIVYGVLRYQKRLDFIISQIANRSTDKIDRFVLHALRVALFQIEYLDRVPDRAAVNESIEAVKSKINRGAVGFINGVLRNYLRHSEEIIWPDKDRYPVKYIANYYSHPEWLCKKWLENYGFEKAILLCKYNNNPPDLRIRSNTLKYNKDDEFIKIFENEGINIIKSGIPHSFIISDIDYVKNLPLYKEGGFIVQGSAATLAGLVLDPAPDMYILDMTAGPGGKTTHLAEIMKNRGEIIALDKYTHKINLVKENCKRLGINIVNTKKIDAVNFNTAKQFDKILLDVPCSGLGVISQKPELKWRITENDVIKLSKLQNSLLHKAVNLLKNGGELLYSTCTLTKEENQQLITNFLNEQENKVKLVPLKNEIENILDINLSFKIKDDFLEFFPPQSNTEGFFMAKIRVNKRS